MYIIYLITILSLQHVTTALQQSTTIYFSSEFILDKAFLKENKLLFTLATNGIKKVDKTQLLVLHVVCTVLT